jgi:hypothetical protein
MDTEAIYALSVLHDAGGTDPNAELINNFSLLAHLGRAEGVTVEDVSGNAFAVMAMALPLTPYAKAALKLADEVPDLRNMRRSLRLAAAKGYLPQ